MRAMPRRPRLDKLLALIRKLAGDIEQGYEEVADLAPRLHRLVTVFSDLEPLQVSISEKTKTVGEKTYRYQVLRVKRLYSDFLEGIILETHITNHRELGDLVAKLVRVRNAFAEWVRATDELLKALEEAPLVLEEYRRVVSPTGSRGKTREEKEVVRAAT